MKICAFNMLNINQMAYTKPMGSLFLSITVHVHKQFNLFRMHLMDV